jgi:PAS domain S-box-containing protein
VNADSLLEAIDRLSVRGGTTVKHERLLDEFMTHVASALDCDVLAFYMVDAAGDRLTRRTQKATGPNIDLPETLDRHSPVMTAVLAGESATDGDVPADLSDRLATLIASPVTTEDHPVGVVLAGWRRPQPLGALETRLLELLAGRTSAVVESAELRDAERRSRLGAEHARRHLALLADVGELVASALDTYEPSLAAVPDLVVPSFADWCSVDLADVRRGSTLQRLAARHIDPAVELQVPEIQRRFPGWAAQIKRIIGGGPGELIKDVRVDPSPGHPVPDHLSMSRALNLVSVMVVPIRVRGLSLGAITFGTCADRRGFRPSDLSVSEVVAARVAVAIERVLLYNETRDAARAASRQTIQLRRLMEAGLEITTRTSPAEVLRVMADQARLVLNARQSILTFADESTTSELRFMSPATAEHDTATARMVHMLAEMGPADSRSRGHDEQGLGPWLCVPFSGADGTVRGRLLLAGKLEGFFTDDDEAILMSMVHTAAVALNNALLYQAIESNERQLQALVDAAPMAIIELDLDQRIRRWNRAAAELFDWPDGAQQPLFHADTAAAIRALTDLVSPDEPVVNIELLMERDGSEAVPTSVSAVTLCDRDGTVTGTLVVIIDVTDRKQLEERVLRSQRLQAVGQLAGGVAHDFNNLLTVVLGYTDLLLNRPLADDDRARRDLEAIRNAGEKAARFTSQLLTMSSRQVVQPVVVDPNDVIRSIEEVLSRVIGETIEVRTELSSVSGVFIDPGYLEQIALNLILNARDAMPDGGLLVVSTSNVFVEDDVPAVGSVVPSGDYVALDVSDTGTGMDKSTLEHCFEPFFTTKASSVGTGMGLATVYGIVNQSHAHVQVETAPGEGTRFRLLFPAMDLQPDGQAATVKAEVARGSEHVLLVEDDPQVRSLAEHALRSSGYFVDAAADGPEALALARSLEQPIDLLVTDVVMPQMGGLALAEELDRMWPDMRVLFVSGYAAGAHEDLSKTSQRGQFLAKPFTAQELVARVRHLLDQ